jgi:membrane-bound serine protease (ClpP class)
MLTTEQNVSDGYIGTVTENNSVLGKKGIATTDLRPSGKVNIDGEVYDAMTHGSFITKGAQICVKNISTNQIIVEEV